MQNKEIKEKWEQIFLQKYGVKSPLDSSIIREKIKNTDLQKYGVKYQHHQSKINLIPHYFKNMELVCFLIFQKYSVKKNKLYYPNMV